MSKRNLTDEREQARDLYINGNLTLPVIAVRLGIHINTIREWAKQENWISARRSVLITGQGAVETFKLVVAKLMEEVRDKVRNGEIPNDLTKNRILDYLKLIREIDGKYDERGTTYTVMSRFTDFLRERNDTETLRGVSACLQDFYQTINAKV